MAISHERTREIQFGRPDASTPRSNERRSGRPRRESSHPVPGLHTPGRRPHQLSGGRARHAIARAIMRRRAAAAADEATTHSMPRGDAGARLPGGMAAAPKSSLRTALRPPVMRPLLVLDRGPLVEEGSMRRSPARRLYARLAKLQFEVA